MNASLINLTTTQYILTSDPSVSIYRHTLNAFKFYRHYSTNWQQMSKAAPNETPPEDVPAPLACKDPSEWSFFDLLTFGWMNR